VNFDESLETSFGTHRVYVNCRFSILNIDSGYRNVSQIVKKNYFLSFSC